ncbi:inner-membrane translocator [Streptomyces sp. NBC_01795]|uniref:inner-membrane translocator n=1 Tax=Streptomyces sp. NBC_01795 TaxID=2975943 RepID=UPI002DD9290E|nr:inner-membrane translocator [Streptomyces sp. NBC_01795]WSA90626.1 inner-membrane translocator [Streptomyces sp. NBC_01795]
MPELADKQPSSGNGPLTAGCLLLLVLVADVADVAAGLLVVIVLAVRGLGRMDAGAGQTANSVPPLDWAPVLGFGALAVAGGVTAVVLLRIGHRVNGAVQLTLCVFLAVHTPGSWP